MPEKPVVTRKLSDKSTKQEMLDAYQALAKELEEKRAAALAPERRLEEKKAAEAVKVATGIAPEGVDRELGGLRSEIGRMLASISDQLAAESARFRNVQKAVESKEQELKELYGIEKAAVSLAALIEAQNQKRTEFETQMAQERDELEKEIETKRAEWEEEKRTHDAEVKERDGAEKKAQDRAREDFNYAFKREQQSIKNEPTRTLSPRIQSSHSNSKPPIKKSRKSPRKLSKAPRSPSPMRSCKSFSWTRAGKRVRKKPEAASTPSAPQGLKSPTRAIRDQRSRPYSRRVKV